MAKIKKPDVTPKASEVEVVADEKDEKVINEEVAEATEETVKEVSEETSDVKNPTEETVTINEEEDTTAPKDKMVKVRLRVDHSCCIGGTRYSFTKDKVAIVPEFVKSVLAREDLLQSL